MTEAESTARPPAGDGGQYTIKSEFVTGIVLFLAGAAVAMVYTSTTAQHYGAYMDRLGPALRIALGLDFAELKPGAFPAAEEFLREKSTDVFQPALVPDHIETVPPSVFQDAHSYLLYSIGYVWRSFGISWSSLVIFPGIFCGLATAGAYALARLVCSRPVAIACAILFLIAPFNVSHTPAIRDYSKVPFLMWTFFLCTCLVAHKPTRKSLLIPSMCLGLVLGAGRGFRFDVVLGIPFYLATLFLFVQDGPKRHIGLKLQSIAAFAVVFAVAGLGIRSATAGGATSHVIALGLMTPFDTMIGIEPSIYDLGYMFGADASAWAIVSDYKQRVAQSPGPLPYVSKDHEKFAFRYLCEVAATFPADMLTRFYASIHTSLTEVPFGISHPSWGIDVPLPPSGDPAGLRDLEGHLVTDRMTAPMYVTNEFLLKLYAIRGSVVSALRTWGLLITAIPLVVLASGRLRLALYGLFFILFWCGSLVLQYDIRHAHHTQIVALLALCIALDRIGRFAFDREFRASSLNCLRPPREVARALVRGTILVVAAIVALWAPLTALRWWQTAHLKEMFSVYEKAPADMIRPNTLASPDELGDVVRIGLNPGYPSSPDTKGLVFSDYYIVEVGRDPSYPSPIVEFRTVFVYPNNEFVKHDRVYRIQLPEQGTTKVFIPVYIHETSKYMRQSSLFLGIDVAKDSLACIKGVGLVEDLSRIRLLPGLVLAPGWANQRLYQQIMTDPAHRRNWILRLNGKSLNAFDNAPDMP